MSCRALAAATTIGTASTAPVPSPRRMPQVEQGLEAEMGRARRTRPARWTGGRRGSAGPCRPGGGRRRAGPPARSRRPPRPAPREPRPRRRTRPWRRSRAAHLREQGDGIGDAGDARGARHRPAAALWATPSVVMPRAPARPPPPRRGRRARRPGTRRGGVADAHVAGDEQVATGGDALCRATPPRRRPRRARRRTVIAAPAAKLAVPDPTFPWTIPATSPRSAATPTSTSVTSRPDRGGEGVHGCAAGGMLRDHGGRDVLRPWRWHRRRRRRGRRRTPRPAATTGRAAGSVRRRRRGARRRPRAGRAHRAARPSSPSGRPPRPSPPRRGAPAGRGDPRAPSPVRRRSTPAPDRLRHRDRVEAGHRRCTARPSPRRAWRPGRGGPSRSRSRGRSPPPPAGAPRRRPEGHGRGRRGRRWRGRRSGPPAARSNRPAPARSATPRASRMPAASGVAPPVTSSPRRLRATSTLLVGAQHHLGAVAPERDQGDAVTLLVGAGQQTEDRALDAAVARSAAPIEPLRSTHSTTVRTGRAARVPRSGVVVADGSAPGSAARRAATARDRGHGGHDVAGPGGDVPDETARAGADGRRGEGPVAGAPTRSPTGGRRPAPVAVAVAVVVGLAVGAVGAAEHVVEGALQPFGSAGRAGRRAPAGCGGRARAGPPGGGRRSAASARPSRPASAAAARHIVRSARRPSAPTSRASRAASLGIDRRRAGRQRRPRRRGHGASRGQHAAGRRVAGVEGEAAPHRLDAAGDVARGP